MLSVARTESPAETSLSKLKKKEREREVLIYATEKSRTGFRTSAIWPGCMPPSCGVEFLSVFAPFSPAVTKEHYKLVHNCASSLHFLHQVSEAVMNFTKSSDGVYSRLAISVRKEHSFLLYIVTICKIAGNNLIFLPWVMCSSPSPLLWPGVGYHNFRTRPHS